jgi:ribosomal protein S18 acetylase RimI-like enzyme
VRKKILRPEKLTWIQLPPLPEDISYPRRLYNCRIDRMGNYFARYESVALNCSEKSLTQIPIYIATDSTEHLSEMLFTVLDETRKRLDFKVISDEPHTKHVEVSVAAIRPRKTVAIAHFFRNVKAMSYSGDIDFFDIRNTADCEVCVNSFYRLSGVRAFTMRSDRIIDELNVIDKEEENRTYHYSISCENKLNDDGILFYYEGSIQERVRTKAACFTDHDMLCDDFVIKIRTVQEDDLNQLATIERAIEGREGRATPLELMDRLRMFPDGFIVGIVDGKVVAYVQSLIWRAREFAAFEEIRNFPLFFDAHGDDLYIIFVATAGDWRRRGIATGLLEAVEKVAREYKVSTISLVAKRSLVSFYESRGFQEVQRLPEFLGNTEGILMRKLL